MTDFPAADAAAVARIDTDQMLEIDRILTEDLHIDGGRPAPPFRLGPVLRSAPADLDACSGSERQLSGFPMQNTGRTSPSRRTAHDARRAVSTMVRAHDVTIDDHRSHDDGRSFFGRFRRHSTAAGRAKGFVSPGRGFDAADVPAVSDLDDATFLALGGGVTIVDFWAPWCGPCKQLHPMFDAQASAHADDSLRFARVNVDENPGVAAACNVMSIPTIITFDADGHEIEREVGLPGRRRLEQMVRSGASLAQAIAVGTDGGVA